MGSGTKLAQGRPQIYRLQDEQRKKWGHVGEGFIQEASRKGTQMRCVGGRVRALNSIVVFGA